MRETHPADDLVALALDDLDPSARAATVEHLSSCQQCREEYDGIAAAIEGILVAAPAVGPPRGFEERVLAALGVEAPVPVSPARRRGRWALVAASAAVGLALGAGATYLLDDRASDPAPAAAPDGPAFELVKKDGEVVGAVAPSFVGNHQVYVVTVTSGPVGMRYRCKLVLQNGGTVPGGRWLLGSQPATWIVPGPAGATQLVLVANDGKGPVWSRASL